MTLEEILKEHEVDLRRPNDGEWKYLYWDGAKFALQREDGVEKYFGEDIDTALGELLK